MNLLLQIFNDPLATRITVLLIAVVIGAVLVQLSSKEETRRQAFEYLKNVKDSDCKSWAKRTLNMPECKWFSIKSVVLFLITLGVTLLMLKKYKTENKWSTIKQ